MEGYSSLSDGIVIEEKAFKSASSSELGRLIYLDYFTSPEGQAQVRRRELYW